MVLSRLARSKERLLGNFLGELVGKQKDCFVKSVEH